MRIGTRLVAVLCIVAVWGCGKPAPRGELVSVEDVDWSEVGAGDMLKQRACVRNLEALAEGVQTYAKKHEGRVPPHKSWHKTLGQCLGGAENFLDTKDKDLFKCPADRSGAALNSYEYSRTVAGKKLVELHADELLVWDREPNHPTGRNCLLADGRVMVMVSAGE